MEALILLIPILILFLVIYILIGMAKAFAKAGKPGWAAIVPVYNFICILEMAGKPMWWLAIIMLVPFVGLVFLIMATIEIAKRFGKGAFTGVMMAFGLGWTGIGFGPAQYDPNPRQ